MMTRRVTFRLYPSKAQTAKLFEARRFHAYLYNACVEHRKTSYQKFGKSVTYLDQQNLLPAFKGDWQEYKQLGAHSLQATVKRVDFAFQRFFKGLGGYPKFQSIRHYSGWTYPDGQSWVAHSDGKNGYLELRDLGLKLQMRGQARTWGNPTTCTTVYRNGKWYASMTVNCIPTRSTGDGAVGLDLGCKEAITLSSGEQISKPEFIKVGTRKVKAASKKLRRKRAPNRNQKIKASRRWKKQRKAVSQLQRKVTRQREDWLHQTTSNIVSSNSLVAGEQLNVKGMTASAKQGKRKAQKAGLNRSILEVGFAMIGKMFEDKLAEAGGFYVESPTRKLKPSQRCAKCWELTPKTLADRVHICSNPKCGHTEDRDVNSAQVNLIWAKGLGTSLLDADALSSTAKTRKTAGSMRQLGQMKRQKQTAAADGETPRSACGGE
jgi:putative transposase